MRRQSLQQKQIHGLPANRRGASHAHAGLAVARSIAFLLTPNLEISRADSRRREQSLSHTYAVFPSERQVTWTGKSQMQTRQPGNSDLHITRLGIGAWAIGGSGWNGSMGAQNESDSIPAIHAALDLGLNWIDTAALYGLGHSEEVVSQTLRGCGPRPYVFTKCERVWDASGAIGACLKAASIRKECEDSLRRLQADVIDLYPDPLARTRQ
jgi:hypothetical protein